MNTTDPLVHSEACIRALARQEAYDLRWPARCGICFGAGGGWSSFDPSPTGRNAPSLGPGTMEDFATCACVDNGQCARCGEQLLGPWWRPLNIRLWLGHKAHQLATRLRYADGANIVRACYWRASALFREDPQPWTWAAYHVAEQLWNRSSNTFGHSRLPPALWALQAWLEHGYESTETPCWHCGWNWNTAQGDAREPRVCECWIPSFEAEQDDAQAWLEQERMHRDFIAGDDGGATHLLVGLPGGPIPVRRLDWHFQGDPLPPDTSGA